MSLSTRLLTGAALALIALPAANAQEVKVGGLVQVWYTQMQDNTLRLNSTSAKYYNFRSEFQENGFNVRRTELKFSGKITDDVEFETMLDPSISTSATNPSILQDAAIKYLFAPGLELKLGQFKNLQTYEGLTSSSEILFAERSQLGRVFGDKRDRGAALSYAFGDPKEFGAKVTAAVFNGMGDAVSGKGADTNAQKDLVLRLDMNVGKEHKFGVYTLQGGTDVKDTKSNAIAANPGGAWPSQQEVYDNKDKTTNLGGFYAFENENLIVTTEYMTGLLGRRFATLGTPGDPNATPVVPGPGVKRESLDQKFTGYYVTGGYKLGAHTFLLRYDVMNYNSGNDWYTAYNPYTESAVGTPLKKNNSVVDYTPEFKEITVGYTYAFKPEKVKAANIKVNYIIRSKNFLAPLQNTTQAGEQGGNTLMAAFQVAF